MSFFNSFFALLFFLTTIGLVFKAVMQKYEETMAFELCNALTLRWLQMKKQTSSFSPSKRNIKAKVEWSISLRHSILISFSLERRETSKIMFQYHYSKSKKTNLWLEKLDQILWIFLHSSFFIRLSKKYIESILRFSQLNANFSPLSISFWWRRKLINFLYRRSF